MTNYLRTALANAKARVVAFFAAFGFKTWGDWRAMLHSSTPVALGALVDAHVMTGSKAALLGALVVAVTSPALAAVNSPAGLRAWFYGLLVPLQLFLVGWGIVSASSAGPIFAVLAAAVGSGVAVANTKTSE